jgi:hypothetical protein
LLSNGVKKLLGYHLLTKCRCTLLIGLGKPVIPLLLKELEKKSGHWFWALKSISREDPVPQEYRGKVKEMTKAWLEWGKQRGYRW